eukprot:GEMP01079272.1.p1 GENE.GEMP01079272.1~~GEMP01079272.1.p1  ORF type:complete len:199 (+),score=11.53 GEMP01079272.1:71-598(+)
MWGISETTFKEHGVSMSEVSQMEKYKKGDLLDSEELGMLLPLWRDLSGRFRHPLYKEMYYQKIGVEISTCWTALRSRICVDSGAAKMYVVIPIKTRANAVVRQLQLDPVHTRDIEVVEDFPANVTLPEKVDFVVFEPNETAKTNGILSTEDAFILELLRRTNLFIPDNDLSIAIS